MTGFQFINERHQLQSKYSSSTRFFLAWVLILASDSSFPQMQTLGGSQLWFKWWNPCHLSEKPDLSPQSEHLSGDQPTRAQSPCFHLILSTSIPACFFAPLHSHSAFRIFLSQNNHIISHVNLQTMLYMPSLQTTLYMPILYMPCLRLQ